MSSLAQIIGGSCMPVLVLLRHAVDPVPDLRLTSLSCGLTMAQIPLTSIC